MTAEKGGGVISQDGFSNSPSKHKESMQEQELRIKSQVSFED